MSPEALKKFSDTLTKTFREKVLANRKLYVVKYMLFSRMRSEGFSFNSWGSGGGALFATHCFYVRNRPQPFATVRGRALRRCHWGKLLQVTRHGCVSLRRYSIVICMKMTCRARNVMHFAAQAQRFVRSSVCYAVPFGLAFGESCFWGVGCGRAIGICVSGCGIEALLS